MVEVGRLRASQLSTALCLSSTLTWRGGKITWHTAIWLVWPSARQPRFIRRPLSIPLENTRRRLGTAFFPDLEFKFSSLIHFYLLFERRRNDWGSCYYQPDFTITCSRLLSTSSQCMCLKAADLLSNFTRSELSKWPQSFSAFQCYTIRSLEAKQLAFYFTSCGSCLISLNTIFYKLFFRIPSIL